MKKIILSLILFNFFTLNLFAEYKEALKLFQENKYQDSLKILGEDLVVDNDLTPDSPNYKIRFLAAHNHWKLGNTKSAVAHFQKCMNIKKDTIDPYIDLSFYHLESNRFRDAAIIARRGLKIKNSAELYYILGSISLQQKNYWKAKQFFEQANSISQESYYCYNSLGITLMKLKNFSDANTAFTVANALNPQSSKIINNLGMSLEMTGKNKEALTYYEKAEEIDSENETIKSNIDRTIKKIKK